MSTSTTSTPAYYGETKCAACYASGPKKGKSCENFAYYILNGMCLCGVHSDKNTRDKLPKNPDASKMKRASEENAFLRVKEVATAKSHELSNFEGISSGLVSNFFLKMV